jgi:predicted ATPase
MGIQELEIKGFRSLRHVRWSPGRLNLLIGPNASGKSNLLRALDFLQKAAAGDLSTEILREGGIGPLLWDGQREELSWNLRDHDCLYELALQPLGTTSVYRVEHELFSRGDLTFIERDAKQAVLRDFENNVVRAHVNTYPEEETLLSTATGPFSGVEVFALRNRLLSWSVYHDLRVDRGAPLRQPAVARLEKRLELDGQNLIPLLHTLYTGNREFKQATDTAMRAAFGSDYDELVFPPAADQRVQLRLRWRSLKTEQSAADLSDGTLRFLLLIAILANREPGDLIAIDEPETGLHPGMFPIIAELATEAAERTQVIFTTHSPQFLDAFREQPPTTTVAERVDGETRLSVLDGNELQRWLKDYSLGALFRSGELEAMA